MTLDSPAGGSGAQEAVLALCPVDDDAIFTFLVYAIFTFLVLEPCSTAGRLAHNTLP